MCKLFNESVNQKSTSDSASACVCLRTALRMPNSFWSRSILDSQLTVVVCDYTNAKAILRQSSLIKRLGNAVRLRWYKCRRYFGSNVITEKLANAGHLRSYKSRGACGHTVSAWLPPPLADRSKITVRFWSFQIALKWSAITVDFNFSSIVPYNASSTLSCTGISDVVRILSSLQLQRIITRKSRG